MIHLGCSAYGIEGLVGVQRRPRQVVEDLDDFAGGVDHIRHSTGDDSCVIYMQNT